MKKTPIINDFRSGELTPGLDARADIEEYYKGCKTLEGCLPIIEGGIARMPGSVYVNPVKQLEEGWNIRVTKSGTGTGTVKSDVAGIDCGVSCYSFFNAGSTIVLSANPDSGCGFAGWSGEGFGGTDPISVLMNGNKIINAAFSLTPKNIILYSIDTDGIYLYASGLGLISGSWYLRVEKRRISDGDLFDEVNIKLAGAAGGLYACKVDGDAVYAGGYYTESGTQYAVVYKLDKNNLSSILWTYTYGVNPYLIHDMVLGANHIYFAGYQYNGIAVLKGKITKSDGSQVWVFNNTTINGQGMSLDNSETYLYVMKNFRGIEKVDVSNGNVINNWTVAGSGNFLRGEHYSGNLYIAGQAPASGDTRYAVSKVNATTAALIWEQYYNTVNQWDQGYTAICDGTYVFAVGYASDNYTERVCCYDLDGNLIWSVVNPTPLKRAIAITDYGDYLYIPGWDATGSPITFFLEKRRKSDGGLEWEIT